MTQVASLIPVDAQPNLALDLVRHFVAQILQADSSPNFIEGVADNKSQDQSRICLFPFYLPDSPDYSGVIRVTEGKPSPTGPMRNASVKFWFRAQKAQFNGGTKNSAQKRALQAAETIFQWTRPGGRVRTETDSTLPSGRLVRLWNNAQVNPDGEDVSTRFVAGVSFDIMFLDINVP